MTQGSLAHRLRVLRAERGLTLREAAAKSGVAKETISDIERGLRHPHDPTLAKIAKGYGVPVEELLEEPVPLEPASPWSVPIDAEETTLAGKGAAPSPEQPPLNDFGEKRRAEADPGWVTEWLSPDFQRAGEALNEYCREWTERQQRGVLDRVAIERFFEDAAHWTPVVEPALIAEVRQLILSGQVPLDPNIDPNDLGRPEFLDLLDRLFSTGKVASAWSRWMDLQHEFLAQAEAQAEDSDPKFLERIAKETEERVARISTLPLSA